MICIHEHESKSIHKGSHWYWVDCVLSPENIRQTWFFLVVSVLRFCRFPVNHSNRSHVEAILPTANLLGFNLWGRGLVTWKCTPRKNPGPCWNLSLLGCKAGQMDNHPLGLMSIPFFPPLFFYKMIIQNVILWMNIPLQSHIFSH